MFLANLALEIGQSAVSMCFKTCGLHEGLFMQDLVNVRLLARILTWSEIAKFDFVSAIDELSSQIKLEFDFLRYLLTLPSCFEYPLPCC
jgi:hypothetical protein